MTVKTDPAITVSTLATALQISEHRVTVRYCRGDIPPPDSSVRATRNGQGVRAWRLSTIRDWNPAVAEKCLAILHALERFPKDAA